MPRNDATQSAVNTTRAALVAAFVTFATTTVPPLHDANVTALANMDPQHPMLADTAREDADFYSDIVKYVNALIAKGRYSGKPLRFP